MIFRRVERRKGRGRNRIDRMNRLNLRCTRSVARTFITPWKTSISGATGRLGLGRLFKREIESSHIPGMRGMRRGGVAGGC